jgi:hypothetical protein
VSLVGRTAGSRRLRCGERGKRTGWSANVPAGVRAYRERRRIRRHPPAGSSLRLLAVRYDWGRGTGPKWASNSYPSGIGCYSIHNVSHFTQRSTRSLLRKARTAGSAASFPGANVATATMRSQLSWKPIDKSSARVASAFANVRLRPFIHAISIGRPGPEATALGAINSLSPTRSSSSSSSAPVVQFPLARDNLTANLAAGEVCCVDIPVGGVRL